MNKNSKLMIIYDDNNHKSNLDENNIIYWNDYAHGDKSILNLIEKNSTTLKKELIHLRKLKVNETRQSQLQTQIEEYDNLLKQHRLKK